MCLVYGFEVTAWSVECNLCGQRASADFYGIVFRLDREDECLVVIFDYFFAKNYEFVGDSQKTFRPSESKLVFLFTVATKQNIVVIGCGDLQDAL